jgi:hypothetical protein
LETGNIITHMLNRKIAMMTDLFAPGWGHYLAWGNADHIPGLIKSYDALLALDFKVFLAGHAYRLGTKQDAELSRAYFVDLWNWTKEAKDTTPFDADAVGPGNLWSAQAIGFNDIADKVTPRLVEKYGKTWQQWMPLHMIVLCLIILIMPVIKNSGNTANNLSPL